MLKQIKRKGCRITALFRELNVCNYKGKKVNKIKFNIYIHQP